MSRKDRIREDDIVELVTPVRFVRCGYPIGFQDMFERVKTQYRDQIGDFLDSAGIPRKFFDVDLGSGPMHAKKHFERIARALAYIKLGQEGMGGRERRLYTESVPEELVGTKFRVESISYCRTGTYYGPSGGYDSRTGEYDYEPGGLDGAKTHIILRLSSLDWTTQMSTEVINVRKVRDGSQSRQRKVHDSDRRTERTSRELTPIR